MLDYNGLHTVDNTCPDDEESGEIITEKSRFSEVRSQKLRPINDQKSKEGTCLIYFKE